MRLHGEKQHIPGIKESPIEEAAVVVVTYKVSSYGLPRAGLWHYLIGNCDSISGVMEVQEYDIKDQGRLSWDVATW